MFRHSRKGTSSWRQSTVEPPRTPSPPLGPILDTVNIEQLDTGDLDSSQAKITDCQYVASYNWVGTNAPTFLVPGAPPAWTPLQKPTKLIQDDGKYFRDQNAARWPGHPMEPAVQSLLAANPEFPCASISVFGCGNTVGQLLRFVRGERQPFRFQVDLVGRTAFFVRRENSPTELIHGVCGYGHTFPEAYTTWETDVKGSESHQRIVRYSFGGLIILVRSESDGYLQDALPEKTDAAPPQMAGSGDPTSLDELSDMLQQKDQIQTGKGLTTGHGGKHVPQAGVFDLKTRSSRKKDEAILLQQVPRLWVNQIPNFVLAFHNQGVFDDVRVEHVRDKVLAWEAENTTALCRLAVLIRKIVDFTGNTEDRKLEVRATKQGTLELRKVTDRDWTALPHDLEVRWTLDGDNASRASSVNDKSALTYGSGVVSSTDPDEESEKDYTACSAEDCGYCGRCSY